MPKNNAKSHQTAKRLKLKQGDHLVAQRVLYTHHGLYIDEGYVAEYSLDYGVHLILLDEFIADSKLRLRCHDQAKYSPQEAVERAKSRLGECSYNLLFSNCEHFVNWCIEGKEYSRQVDNIIGIFPPLAMASMVKELSDSAFDVIYKKKDLKDAINQAAASPNINPIIKTGEIIEDVSGINVLNELEQQTAALKQNIKKFKSKRKSEISDLKQDIKDLQNTLINDLKKIFLH